MHDKGPCLGYQALALVNTAASSLTIPKYADGMLIRSETANVRFRMDGTAATTATTGGMPLLTTDSMPLWLEGLALPVQFSAIASGGAAATLHILYFGCAEGN